MSSDPNILRAAELCRAWAENEPLVTRVYFFGSRIYGTPRQDSDLDICIVSTGPEIACDEKGNLESLSLNIEKKLQDFLPYKPHITVYMKFNDAAQHAKNKGVLVYSQYNDLRDFQREEDEDDLWVDDIGNENS